MIEAQVIKDSVSRSGDRLTTVQATFHRFVLAEHNTHRMAVKSSASSRAIPVARQIENLLTSPAMPVSWGINQAGMQAEAEFDPHEVKELEAIWLKARDSAVDYARELMGLGVHKQVTNRLLEPFMWHTAVITATDMHWRNFFLQRCSPLAQPEMRASAESIREAYTASNPIERALHLPYVTDDEEATLRTEDALAISTARSARTSYRTFDGTVDHAADLILFDKLFTARPKHWAPSEHVAFDTARHQDSKLGPFSGWTALRHSNFLPALLTQRGISLDPETDLIF